MQFIPPRPAAVILAGGRGERLGGAIKSGLTIGNERLLDRVATRLGSCEPLLIAHGRLDPILLQLDAAMIPVPDLPGDYAGPLAGLAGAIAFLVERNAADLLLVSAAVDTPFLPPDFVARLVGALGDGAAAISSWAGQPYPTNGIWRVSAFADLPARIVAGTAPRSLKSLAASAGGIVVEWPETVDGDPFANLNTPEDRTALEARAARDTKPSQ